MKNINSNSKASNNQETVPEHLLFNAPNQFKSYVLYVGLAVGILVILLLVSLLVGAFQAGRWDSYFGKNQPIDSTNKQNLSEANPKVPNETGIQLPNEKDLIKPLNVGGRGILNISNGTNSDAISKLVDNKTSKTVRLVYIQAGREITIKNIKNGQYLLKFSLGNGYLSEKSKFLSNQSYSQFIDIFIFQEKKVDGGVSYDTFSVTLNPVVGGTANTSSIVESDFDDK